MKKMILGGRKGYLEKKEIVEEKLKNKYTELKDKHITKIDVVGKNSVAIFFNKMPEDRGGYYFLPSNSTESILIVKKEEFLMLLDVPEMIDCYIVSEKKSAMYSYLSSDALFDDLHYIFSNEDPLFTEEIGRPEE